MGVHKEDPIDTLRQSLYSLTTNPGDYDDQMSFLQGFLVSTLTDEKSLVAAIDEIVSIVSILTNRINCNYRPSSFFAIAIQNLKF